MTRCTPAMNPPSSGLRSTSSAPVSSITCAAPDMSLSRYSMLCVFSGEIGGCDSSGRLVVTDQVVSASVDSTSASMARTIRRGTRFASAERRGGTGSIAVMIRSVGSFCGHGGTRHRRHLIRLAHAFLGMDGQQLCHALCIGNAAQGRLCGEVPRANMWPAYKIRQPCLAQRFEGDGA